MGTCEVREVFACSPSTMAYENRYANPLPEEPLPTREELLETLGRMKRNSRDGPKVHSPRTSKFPSEGPKKEEAKRDEGWGARTKRLAGTAENLMEIDGGGWGQPAAQQVGGNETGWDHSPATKQAVGGDKRTESTSAWGITSAPQPAPKIHPDRLKMMGGGPPLSTAPPRRRYPPTFDADRLNVRETITGPRQRWGERVVSPSIRPLFPFSNAARISTNLALRRDPSRPIYPTTRPWNIPRTTGTGGQVRVALAKRHRARRIMAG